MMWTVQKSYHLVDNKMAVIMIEAFTSTGKIEETGNNEVQK